jgi:hypothetical protein
MILRFAADDARRAAAAFLPPLLPPARVPVRPARRPARRQGAA